MARIKLRRDTEANWIAVNPILDLGEPGYVTDTEQLKIGNGVDDWNTLSYFFGGFDGGTINQALYVAVNGTETDGALILNGEVYDGDGVAGLLQVGPTLNFSDINLLATFVANLDDYAQVIISNKNAGTSSSADLVVNNDSPSGDTIYGNFGINGTNYIGTGGPFDQPNGTYLLAAGGELSIGTKDSNNLRLATNDVARLEINNVGEAEFQPSSRVHILNITDATSHDIAALVIEGGLGVGKTIVCDDNIYIGQNSVNVPLTDPVLVAKQNGTGFIQVAVINENNDASADFVTYTNSSTESNGWADLGYAGSTFNDPAYTLTPPGSGYVIVQGLNNTTTTGSLILSTGNTGTTKDIVLGTGGFLTTNERIRLIHSTQTFHIKMNTASTNTNTGALVIDGGVGIDGTLNVGQTINKVTITPPTTPATLTLGSGITLSHPQSLTFPNNAGSSGAVLTTNGSGTLSYVAQENLQITKLPFVNISGVNYGASDSNNIICIDPTGSPKTVTLPSNAAQGKVFTIKKTTAGSTVTINADNVFCTIDGAATYVLNALEAVTVVMGNDGSNNVYYVIGKVV